MRQISWTHNVVILGVTNSIEEKFKVYRRKVIMNLSENTEFIEDESFEKEFIKRLRLRTEENVKECFIRFTQGDNVSGVAREELQGIEDLLYEYYISEFEESHEWSQLSNEEKWNILDEKVNNFYQNFTDSKLKEIYENINFTEEENKYMQLKKMRCIEEQTSAKNALVEIIIRRKLLEMFGKEEISKMLRIISEKSFEGKRHIIQLMSDNPFGKNVIERWEKEIDERVQYLFKDNINCGGYALKIDQCFLTPESSSTIFVEEDSQVISSYLEKFPFIRLLGNTKLEDDEYIVIYRTEAGHAADGRHFIRVEKDGTITEKDGNSPVRKFKEWTPAFQNEEKIIEVVFAVKEKHRMFGYTYEDVNKNCNGKNFEQTVKQAIKEKRNSFTYHCKEYALKKDKEGNIVVCSEEGEKSVIVADVLLDDKEDENIECVTVIREGYDGQVENYEGKIKPIIVDGKLVNYDCFRNIKGKVDEREDIENDIRY